MPNHLLLGREFRSTLRSPNRILPGMQRSVPPLVSIIGEGIVAIDPPDHVITIAPPYSNKAGAAIVPNLLSYRGPVVVIDTTGTYYSETFEARSSLGPVFRLDPFRMIDSKTDALNPLDLIDLMGLGIESSCQLVAEMVSSRDPFTTTERNASMLLSAIIGYLMAVPEKNKTFSEVIRTLNSDDVVYNLAVVLDTIGKRLCPLSFQVIASFLGNNSDAERNRILSAANAQLMELISDDVSKTLNESTVPLADLVEGKLLTVYLMIPGAQLRSYSLLMRLWLGTVLHCLSSRRTLPRIPTLLMLDETSQFGRMPILESVLTTRERKGFQAWTFWDDVSQIRQLHPAIWPSIVKNCGAIQLFGTKDYTAAIEAADLLGIEPEDIRCLTADEIIVRMDGNCHRMAMIDYLTDPLFKGQIQSDEITSH